MALNAVECTQWMWMLVGLYWLIASLGSKPVARRQSMWSRAFHLTLMTAAFALLFSEEARVGYLQSRLLPEVPAIGWFGFGVAMVGCAFAVWARARLGSNWSASVTRKRDHEFIRGGPYAIVRHPIYAGLLLGILGTAIALGKWGGLVGLGLAFVTWWSKARVEEQFLVEAFGGEYVSYRREVKQLIPFLF
jgi:protein-S-isoprenylcysteine O-methyltransferase Ste14